MSQDRIYECMVIINPNKASANEEKARKDVEAILKNRGGEILYSEKWDDRRLAYPIRKFERGFYHLLFVRLNSEMVATLRRDMEMDEDILRQMFVAKESDFVVPKPGDQLFRGLAAEQKMRRPRPTRD